MVCRKFGIKHMFGLDLLIWLCFISLLVSSCSPTSISTAYFKSLQKDTVLMTYVNENFESKIKPNDLLGISISSMNREEDIFFNSAAGQEKVVLNGVKAFGYHVNDRGMIQMHQLGSIKVAGLTRNELKEKLQRDLMLFLKDPIVNVDFLNHKITILGDVARPQVLNLAEESISVPDALAICGDLNITARRDNVLIVREDNGNKKVKRISLTDHSLFNSSWYLLKPNDIVYVSTDDEKRMKDEKRSRNVQVISLALSSLSLLVVLIDRILN